jgi:hypothetical protein
MWLFLCILKPARINTENNQLMKHLLALCAVICMSVFARAQTTKVNVAPTPKYDNNNAIKHPGTVPDKLKVSLTEDKMFIVYKNQEIPSASIRVLDSLIKKVPGKDQLVVEFENTNAEAETVKSVDAVLKQCQCSVSKKSIRWNKQ